jgi:hypothetical protein
VDPCELLSSIEAQIAAANEESLTRKDIMERVDRWLSACDEETWLEEYNQVCFSSKHDIVGSFSGIQYSDII